MKSSLPASRTWKKALCNPVYTIKRTRVINLNPAHNTLSSGAQGPRWSDFPADLFCHLSALMSKRRNSEIPGEKKPSPSNYNWHTHNRGTAVTVASKSGCPCCGVSTTQQDFTPLCCIHCRSYLFFSSSHLNSPESRVPYKGALQALL